MNTAQENEHFITDPRPPGRDPSPPSFGPPSENSAAQRKMGLGQRIVVVVLLTIVIAPPMAAFYSYFSGVPLHLLASTKKEENEGPASTAGPSISLASGMAHTVAVPEEVCAALGIRKGEHVAVAEAQPPTAMRPLVLPGSTAFDPARIARIKARFAPARVVDLAKVPDWESPDKSGHTELRELRAGDNVSKGDRLGTFYSVDVGSRKNDLLDALVQLELDQKIYDEAEKHNEAVTPVLLLQFKRAVQGDRNLINKALNNLELWDIPQNEVDDLHAEAQKLSADKNAWFKTREGKWVRGEKLGNGGKVSLVKANENPWGRVTLNVPFDGVIVERNVHTGEMVVDNTINLFQIADVTRLMVTAHCPEDELPTLEALQGADRSWTVRTVGAASASGFPGHIDQIGYVIDPNQHTLQVQGYVENPGKHMRAGQFVTATVKIPPPKGVVEIPTDALVDDGLQAIVFVQPDKDALQFTMRRVQVTHRFAGTVFVRATPIPKDEQLTTQEAEEGLLPKEALRPGDLVLLSGTVELKAALSDLESRHEKKPKPGKG